MKINRCMNCMTETETYPCPHCGYGGSNVPKLDYALTPGRILGGRYLVGQSLGRGGFGITYIGLDLALEQKVAIKEFFPTVAAARDGRSTTMLSWKPDEQTQKLRQAGLQSVLAEARKMAKLENVPRVVMVRDVLEENNTAYIVMDYVEGETLKKHLMRTGAMSWDEARPLFLPVLDAMEQVHAAKLIHRDISPDNLMLTPDGKLRILDLGAAKDVSASGGGKSEEVVKNGFSPFEQYTQRGSSGPWTDVYAMAATILYTLTGKVPPSALDRISNDTLNFDAPEYQSIPVGVRQALCHAMAPKRENRTQSIAAFSKELTAPAASNPQGPPPCRRVYYMGEDGLRYERWEEVPPKAPEKQPGQGQKSKGKKQSKGTLKKELESSAQAQDGKQDTSSAKDAIQDKTGSESFTASEITKSQNEQTAGGKTADNTKKSASKKKWLIAAAAVLVCAVFLLCNRCLLLGHEWMDATCTEPKTCSVCGKTEGEALGHSWEAATCTTAKTCSVCGETEGSASGHSWEAATCTTPKTCSVCGETEGSAKGHTWVEATYETPKTCSVCGETEGNVKGYTATVAGMWYGKVKITTGSYVATLSRYTFLTEITNCRQLTVTMEATMDSGTSCKDWEVYGIVDGSVKNIGSIYLPDGSGSVSATLEFDDPINLTAIAICPKALGGYSWSMSISVTDVYTTE